MRLSPLGYWPIACLGIFIGTIRVIAAEPPNVGGLITCLSQHRLFDQAEIGAFVSALAVAGYLLLLYGSLLANANQHEQASLPSDAAVQALLDASTETALLMDREGTVTALNEVAAHALGGTMDELIGTNLFAAFPPQVAELRAAKAEEVLASGKPARFEDEHAGRTLDSSIYPVFDDDGTITHLAIFAKDITEAKRAEDALREGESNYRTLLENLPQRIFLKDTDSVYISCNENYAQDLGTSPEEVVGKTDYDFFPRELADKYRADDSKTMTSGKTEDIEERYIRDGQEIIVQTVKTRVQDASGNTLGVLGIFWDITQRKQAEEQLRSQQERLRALATKLSLAQEQERRAIAADLHDDIGQALALCKIRLQALRESAGSVGLAQPVDGICKLIDQIIQHTRSLTFQLSPPILYDQGFGAAVQWLIEQIEEDHGVVLGIDDDRQPKPMDDDVSIILFRAVRELLLNVVKHAQTDRGRVSISRDDDVVRVVVEDEGVGFDPAGLDYRSRHAGFGLFNIRERLDYARGSLEIESQPGSGTRVTIVAPLTVPEQAPADTEQ